MMYRVVHLYVGFVCLIAALVGWGVAAWAHPVSDAFVTAAVAFALLGLLAERLSHGIARGAVGSIAFIPFLTACLLAPSWVALLAAAVAIAVIQLIVRRVWLKALFNVAQYVAALGLATLVYTWTGGESLLLPDAFKLIPYVGLFTTFLAANTLAVSCAIALSEGQSVASVWRHNTLKSLRFDVLALPVAYFFAWFYREHGIFGAVSLAIPMIGFRQLYKTHWQLEQVHEELLQMMVAAIEARDPYTSGHSKRVSRNAKLIARMMGLSSKQIDQIGVAALLHDVGKIHEEFAPILRKPGRLTPEEWALMQTHPVKSAALASHVSHLRHAIAPIRHHHENWDGSGYPDGVAGEEIPLGSRIITFADTIDAMTSDRPYRRAMTKEEVRAEFIRMRGKQFDPVICDRLLASPQFGLLFDAHVSSHPSPEVNAQVPRPSLFTPQFVASVGGGKRQTG